MIFSSSKEAAMKLFSGSKQNVFCIDGGNSMIKYLDCDNKVGIIKTACIDVSKVKDYSNSSTYDYYVSIYRVGKSQKFLGKFLFGLAASASEDLYEERSLGKEKYSDKYLIYQMLTIIADKKGTAEPIEVRAMLPFAQIEYKDLYKKLFLGEYKVIFHNKKDKEVKVDIETVNIAIEGKRSFESQMKRILSEGDHDLNKFAGKYARKIIMMLDIGGGTIDIPWSTIEKSDKYYKTETRIFSTKFGMNFISGLIIEDLGRKNKVATIDEIVNAIINYDCKVISDGKELSFKEELKQRAIAGFEAALKRYLIHLKANQVDREIGIIFISGGGACVLKDAFEQGIYKNTISGVDLDVEIRIVGDPIYHNVLSLKGSV
ncbi:MAG TPA: hypothetical protein VK426_06410 [Methanobacterium sp.]|nr:hypothetical protein [Methanobacterium sp.]